jgi:hypothetical protein
MSMNISANVKGASQEVLSAIQNASAKTGVDFDYLVNQARTESSFRTDVEASTSSATGLYQFIDQTWLGMVSKHGSKHGLSEEANIVKQDFQGRYYVPNDTQKNAILNLRKDPKIASLMAAEFASGNQKYLENKTGKNVNSTDLYLSHFLGAGGASKFINGMQSNPEQSAASLLHSAANANKNIFYKSDGSAKSLDQIYRNFEAKFDKVTEVQTAKVTLSPVQDKSYVRDVQFERMYGDKVAQFVNDLPRMNGFESSSFFEGMFGSDVASVMQNGFKDQSLFLTLAMLDLPK